MDPAILDFLISALRIATPLVFAALGGIISERAGVFAVGLEGMMLAGAFGAAVAAFTTGNAAAGVFAALFCGACIAGVIALVTVRFGAEQMVTGLAANILAIGLTSFLLRSIVGGGQAPVIQVPLLQAWPIPVLSDIPVLGPLLFNQPPLTYLALLLTIPLFLFLMRTQYGLTLRSVGENPQAAYAIGADPKAIRFWAVIAGGAIAGLGGAVLALQQVGTFTDAMTSGRGYLALAAIIVGRWTPFGALAACLVFGAAEALYLRVQTFGLPVSSYVVQMLPYLIAIFVLALMGRAARLPAAIGIPYDREAK
jgi:general nucleoside transport system permease protein